jgi:hypothetical protein
MKIYKKIVYDKYDNIIEEDSYEYEGPLALADPVTAGFTAAMGVAQYKQQGAIGKYNQANANRNALVAEQEGEQIQRQAEFDIARFDQQFRQAEGTVAVSLSKSGVVVGSGSAARIAMANAMEAQMQRNVTQYNADIGTSRKMEEANFSRIAGKMARQQARLAQISTIANTGTSLLKMNPAKTNNNIGYNQNNVNAGIRSNEDDF